MQSMPVHPDEAERPTIPSVRSQQRKVKIVVVACVADALLVGMVPLLGVPEALAHFAVEQASYVALAAILGNLLGDHDVLGKVRAALLPRGQDPG